MVRPLAGPVSSLGSDPLGLQRRGTGVHPRPSPVGDGAQTLRTRHPLGRRGGEGLQPRRLLGGLNQICNATDPPRRSPCASKGSMGARSAFSGPLAYPIVFAICRVWIHPVLSRKAVGFPAPTFLQPQPRDSLYECPMNGWTGGPLARSSWASGVSPPLPPRRLGKVSAHPILDPPSSPPSGHLLPSSLYEAPVTFPPTYGWAGVAKGGETLWTKKRCAPTQAPPQYSTRFMGTVENGVSRFECHVLSHPCPQSPPPVPPDRCPAWTDRVLMTARWPPAPLPPPFSVQRFTAHRFRTCMWEEGGGRDTAKRMRWNDGCPEG